MQPRLRLSGYIVVVVVGGWCGLGRAADMENINGQYLNMATLIQDFETSRKDYDEVVSNLQSTPHRQTIVRAH